MKTLISLFALLSSSLVLAAATCPQGSTTHKVCTSTPKAGDNDMAAQVFDSIAVCSKGQKVVLVMEKNGESQAAPATAEVRMGGTSYNVKADDGVTMSLSFVTGTRYPSTTAKFTVNFTQANLSSSSTYTCK